MDFIELARERYSLKKYDGRRVSREKLDLILEAARLSPTAKNLQNYFIYVAESDDALAKVDEVTPCRYGSSTVLILTFDRSKVFTYPGGNMTLVLKILLLSQLTLSLRQRILVLILVG